MALGTTATAMEEVVLARLIPPEGIAGLRTTTTTVGELGPRPTAPLPVMEVVTPAKRPLPITTAGRAFSWLVKMRLGHNHSVTDDCWL